MALSRLALVVWCALAVRGCELEPSEFDAAKSPGDNFYRVIVNGDVERYVADQRYVVTLVGSRTHSRVQQFTQFKLTLAPQHSPAPAPARLGQFQLFADTLTKFSEDCINSVVQADDLPKTEVAVMWKAPPAGSGCVLIKAMVFESADRWFAEDGQLTKVICEDTSASSSDCCACDDAKYKMVFEGLWSAKTHPKDFPTQALWLTHFSDVIGATHVRNFSFWGEGEIATDGFRSLAEWGSIGLLEQELSQRGKLLRTLVKAPGLWYPRVNTNTSTAFVVDRNRHLLSVASMFGPSPDWVVGVSGLDLCMKDCTWAESKVIDLYPYDAGTDNGLSYLSPNSATFPRERMSRITPMYPEDPRSPFYAPGTEEVPPLARLYLTREKLLSKACDDNTLMALVGDQKEDVEEADKPECAVSAWGPWSACSVSCGKGLRMRGRNYLRERDAKMAGCGRQLLAKEMCVAEVAECPAGSLGFESELPGPSDASCATTAWGGWSACSETCGAGLVVRRRAFVSPGARKRCPLVPVEETKPCGGPPCPSQALPDPACPTTAWSGWSPCSASCGGGARLRTRLLLVDADRQQECAAKVTLVQQQKCVEKETCALDMVTAKKVCMEPMDAGPCRGTFERWAFVGMKGMCVPFQFGGCLGNRNNFLSQRECTDTCAALLGGAAGQPSLPVAVSANETDGNLADDATVDCQLGPWSDWSKCSVSCGAGHQEKTRTVMREAGPGGVPCPDKLSRRRRCYRRC